MKLIAQQGENIYSFSMRLCEQSKMNSSPVCGVFNEIELVCYKGDSESAIEWQYQYKSLARRVGKY